MTFFPDQLEDPTISVEAHYDGPDVTVYVALSGTIQDLQKSFTSNPAMSENEILYYLATGQRQTQAQQSDPANLQTQMTDAALSALGAAAIGVVKGAVQSVLPLGDQPRCPHRGDGRRRTPASDAGTGPASITSRDGCTWAGSTTRRPTRS